MSDDDSAPPKQSAGQLLTGMAERRRLNEAAVPKAHPTIEQMDTLFANEIMADMIASEALPEDEAARALEANPEIAPLVEKRQREIEAARPKEPEPPADDPSTDEPEA